MFLRSLASAVTKRHSEKRILATHPIHLFRIIQDVDAYSEFLPLCSHSKVISRESDGRSFRGSLTVGMPPFKETYVSHVSVSPENWTIEARSVESKLFDELYSKWRLQPLEDFQSCHVDFEIEMTVSNPIIKQTLDNILEQIGRRQVAAFEERCQAMPFPPDLT